MAQLRYIAQETAKVKDPEDGKLITTLFWGDEVELLDPAAKEHRIMLLYFDRATGKWTRKEGLLPAKTQFTEKNPVLKVRFVDVGQGDGAIVETPGGKLILIDGGEGTNFRRYVSVAFKNRFLEGALSCAAVVVTHGDADHFTGLTKLIQRKHKDGTPAVIPAIVFHNGLVKRAKPKDRELEEVEAFGTTVNKDGATYCTELLDDLIDMDAALMNRDFKAWRKALQDVRGAGHPVKMQRLEYGMDNSFTFLDGEDPAISVQVMGPVVDEINSASTLRFLRKPGSQTDVSASHTVNGHSIVLKLTCGNVRFLFGADLNEEAEERLLEEVERRGDSLEAEILKVPHHGSHEFKPEILAAISPVVSIVSSGDESGAKEYIHPRSGLVGALGKHSRAEVAKPLIFVTEMVAFFAQTDKVYRKREPSEVKPGESQYQEIKDSYVKSQFGIVHVRTDGRKVLVITHSGRADRKEHYTFTVDENHKVTFHD